MMQKNPVDRRLLHSASAAEYLVILILLGGITTVAAAFGGDAISGSLRRGGACVSGADDACRMREPRWEEFKFYPAPTPAAEDAAESSSPAD